MSARQEVGQRCDDVSQARNGDLAESDFRLQD